MVACVWSVDLREGGCVVVYIILAGVGMRMRRDETVRREGHLFR